MEGASLAGQVAVVTGAGRGIGRAIACGLAARGMAVACAARTATQLDETVGLIQSAGGRAIAQPTDVSSEAANQALLAAARDTFGPVDLFVNSAATLEGIGPIWTVDPDVWWRDVEIALRGAMLGMRAAIPAMLERGTGRLVNVASVAGLSANPGGSGYTAAKMAVIRLTESVAASLASTGVACFVIDPGMVRTYLTEHLVDAPESGGAYAYLPRMFDEIGVDASEAADLVAFLATGAADALSGRFISVADDYEELSRRSAEVLERDLYQVRWRRFEDARRLSWP